MGTDWLSWCDHVLNYVTQSSFNGSVNPGNDLAILLSSENFLFALKYYNLYFKA